MIFDGALSLIGNTPMVRLENLGYPNVYVKIEKNNPGGSIKDRVAYYMIKCAEERNELTSSAGICKRNFENRTVSGFVGGPEKIR